MKPISAVHASSHDDATYLVKHLSSVMWLQATLFCSHFQTDGKKLLYILINQPVVPHPPKGPRELEGEEDGLIQEVISMLPPPRGSLLCSLSPKLITNYPSCPHLGIKYKKRLLFTCPTYLLHRICHCNFDLRFARLGRLMVRAIRTRIPIQSTAS